MGNSSIYSIWLLVCWYFIPDISKIAIPLTSKLRTNLTNQLLNNLNLMVVIDKDNIGDKISSKTIKN